LAEKIEEHEIDKDLIKKAANSMRIPWDHQTICKQQTKLKQAAKKDPELGLQKLKTYKLERQKVTREEGRLPQNPGVTIK